MSKIKMRCNSCGKWFQSANAKEVTCPDCLHKARKEKLTARSMPPSGGSPGNPGAAPPRQVPPPPPKSKPAIGGSSHWLDTQNDVKVGQPDQPRPKIPSFPAPRDNRSGQERNGYRGPALPGGPGGYREERGPAGPGRARDPRGPAGPAGYRGPGPAAYRVGGGMGVPDIAEQRPRQPMPTGPGRGPRPQGPAEGRPEKSRQGGKFAGHKARAPKPQAPPRPKREKIPPPTPFVPTAEQVARVEARYAELATPGEFDGIRTQIASELGIPKTAVKKIVKEYRDRLHLPSWWESQTYKGDREELEKIKAAYEPLLPVPPVGVHKQIAERLGLKPSLVYQAIKTIRLEMQLPQFNDPQLHGKEEQNGKAPEASQGVQEAQEQREHHADNREDGPLEQQEPGGKITSIETDTAFQRHDDTIEVAAADDYSNASSGE
jgi:hypothetical protein